MVQTPYRFFYTGNGVQTDFTVPDDYIRKAHVYIEVDEVPVTEYTWFNDSTIRFDVAPAVGTEIRILREPPYQEPLNLYTGGTVITELSLDENANQSLQITERALFADYADTAGYAETAGLTEEANLAFEATRLTPGGNINGIPFTGEDDINVFPDGSLGEYASANVTINVDPGQTATGQITLPIKVHIVAMEATAPCWLRVYSVDSALTADVLRLRTIPPARGIGVVADPVFTAAQTIWWDPTETFVNRQDPPSTVYPLRITNDSPSATSITITVNYYFF